MRQFLFGVTVGVTIAVAIFSYPTSEHALAKCRYEAERGLIAVHLHHPDRSKRFVEFQDACMSASGFEQDTVRSMLDFTKGEHKGEAHYWHRRRF